MARTYEPGIGMPRTSTGGSPQKYILSEYGRRLMHEQYDGTSAGIDALAKELKVPRHIIKRWAQHLDLTRGRLRPWTVEEDEYLEANISRGKQALATYFGRSVTEIIERARVLDLQKFQDGYSMRAVCEGLGCDMARVQRWVQCGWLAATRYKKETGEDGMFWNIRASALKKLVKQHPEEVDPRRVCWTWLVDILTS